MIKKGEQKKMKQDLINRNDYDHPEHFDDVIREYKSSERYFPTPLEDLLLEQCGHKCTICFAPYCEIHHIDFLKKDLGKTEYENLIVLCPNCHTRVHKDNIPTKNQLRQHKLKLEIVYTLPIISRLTTDERKFIIQLSKMDSDISILNYSRREYEAINTDDYEEAKIIFRNKIGLLYLEINELIRVDFGSIIGKPDEKQVGVELFVRPTPKAIKWIKYLKKSERLNLIENTN
jgi:5-methylcytosine-specific restriction endonuclease McrA